MKGRSTTLEALSCLSDMKDGTIAINGVFIRETAQDAYGHLKEFCKIKAENSKLRTTVRQQKSRITNLEAELTHAKWITTSDEPDRLICSRCGRRFDMYFFDQKDMPYCLCGAKMDGGS